MDIISKRLTELHTKRGNTQEEFAEYLNVSQQDVNEKIELGKTILNEASNDCNLNQPEASSPFSQSVMKKLYAIKRQIDNNRADIVEQYYQEHGTFKGIDDWLDTSGY